MDADDGTAGPIRVVGRVPRILLGRRARRCAVLTRVRRMAGLTCARIVREVEAAVAGHVPRLVGVIPARAVGEVER